MQVQTQNTGAPQGGRGARVKPPYIEIYDDHDPLYVGVFGPFSVPTLPPIDDDGCELIYVLVFSEYANGRRFSVIVRKVTEVSVNLDKYYEIEDALMDVGHSIVVADIGRVIKCSEKWYILDKENLDNPKLIIFEEYEGS